MRYYMAMKSTSRILELVERLGMLLRADLRRIGTETALQPVHLQALQYLARCNRYSNTPAALGAYLGQTKGTVSQSLKVMERQGYLEKHEDPEDRRVVRLALTAKARSLLERVDPPDAWAAAEQSLAPAQHEAVAEGLEALLRSLQKAHGGRAFGVCAHCRHFQSDPSGAHRCGLTGEPLSEQESLLICQEQEERISA
jgi:MarR family transcriptional regulator, negative regulator of the multidrug operon emrRAB